MKKVVIISGGSDGLGREVAKQLSPNNTVIILSPSLNKLMTVSKEIHCEYQVCDVSDYHSVEESIQKIIDRYQRIDCLINNAGVWIQGELSDNSPEDIERVIEVNTTGTIFLTKAVIPQMKKQKEGRIINIISQAGLYGKAERSVYIASKFALSGFTKSMQPELAKYGIGVMGIYPGKMKTAMFQKMGIKKDMKDGLDPKDVAKTIEFILSLDNTTIFPEIGIKHIDN